MRTNPFGAWLMKEPRIVTKASVSRDLGLHPTYVRELMADDCTLMPSLPVAIAIERRTGGKVTVQQIHNFVAANRAAQAERRAAA